MGEHLPCKQGVKSSNLSISISIKMIKSFLCSMYLENHILKEEKIESSKKKISRHPRDIPKGISKRRKPKTRDVTLYIQELVKLIRA